MAYPEPADCTRALELDPNLDGAYFVWEICYADQVSNAFLTDYQCQEPISNRKRGTS